MQYVQVICFKCSISVVPVLIPSSVVESQIFLTIASALGHTSESMVALLNGFSFIDECVWSKAGLV